jgi:UDP-N-acetylglucosamine acyltransferase
MSKIHSTAIIHPSAKIADDVEIGAFSVIGENAVLEKGVVLKNNVTVEYATIGENTVISAFAVIGTEPQDLGYKGEKTGVIIGQNCQIREFVTVNRAAKEGNTIVGDNCLLMTSSHVGHNGFLEDNVILANNAILAGHVKVGFGAFLGGTTVVHQNCKIGRMVIMSGFSGTRQDIPPYAKTAGVPAYVAGMNTIGMKRRGLTQEDRNLVKEAYKFLFHSGLNTSQALEKIESELDSSNEHVQNLIEFVKTSKRGIIKAHEKSPLE